MTRVAKYNDEYCIKAEEILSQGKSLAAVCAAMDIGRTTLYEWRENHPEFKFALARGLEKAQIYWEQIGEDGVKGNYEKFGGAPWIFTMKNRFRADYAEEREDKKTLSDTVVEKLLDRLVDS
jgi:hypothetical protein